MLAQNLELLWNLRSGLEIAGVGVACDQAQRLLLATTGNQNRRMWPREALRKVERMLDAVVLPLDRTRVSLFTMPHAQADLEHLLQPLVALFEWWERQSRPACLLFVIASSDAKPSSPPRKHIQGGHRLRQQDGVPVGRRRRQGKQLDPTGVSCQVRQGGIAREHLALRPAEIVGLPHMVHRPDPIKSPRVGSLRDLDQCGAKLTRSSRPVKIIDVES